MGLVMPTPEQLVFELPHRAAMGFEDFLVSRSNDEAVALVDRWPDWPVGAAIICGPKGSGKTHLANVWRLRSHAAVVPASEIARADVPRLVEMGGLVIEELTSITDEAAIFHILNLVREQRLNVLLTTRIPPGELGVALPDLHSRLKALPVAAIAPPDDSLLRAVLVKLFADRQLSIDPRIVDFVLLRIERSMAAAALFVAEADRRALVAQRRLTRAIAQEALENLGQ